MKVSIYLQSEFFKWYLFSVSSLVSGELFALGLLTPTRRAHCRRNGVQCSPLLSQSPAPYARRQQRPARAAHVRLSSPSRLAERWSRCSSASQKSAQLFVSELRAPVRLYCLGHFRFQFNRDSQRAQTCCSFFLWK